MFCGIYRSTSEVFPGGNAGKADGGRRDDTKGGTKKEAYKKEVNYSQLAGQAVSNLGVSYTEFWDLSLAEFHYMHTAHGEYENMILRRMYVVARFEAYLILGPKLDKGTRVTDIYTFPWEEDKKQKKQTPEEIRQAMKRMALSFGTKPKQEKLPVTKK